MAARGPEKPDGGREEQARFGSAQKPENEPNAEGERPAADCEHDRANEQRCRERDAKRSFQPKILRNCDSMPSRIEVDSIRLTWRASMKR